MICREAINIITDDMNKDGHSVAHFSNLIVEYLEEKRELKLDRVIQFTDGCSGQFKSKMPFADISCGFDKGRIKIERNFFGSCHGKGPSDGEGGVVKSKVTQHVKSGGIVTSTDEFYQVARELLAKPPTNNAHVTGYSQEFRRHFIIVKSNEIPRRRGNRNAKTVSGTRSIHCVAGVAPGIIKTRRLSCYCAPCLADNDKSAASCELGHLSWNTVQLAREDGRPWPQPVVKDLESEVAVTEENQQPWPQPEVDVISLENMLGNHEVNSDQLDLILAEVESVTLPAPDFSLSDEITYILNTVEIGDPEVFHVNGAQEHDQYDVEATEALQEKDSSSDITPEAQQKKDRGVGAAEVTNKEGLEEGGKTVRYVKFSR
jgi:hypothetical protein